MNIGTYLYTWFRGKFVGKDEIGNRYFCNSNDFNSMNAKRWVLYSGEIEASNIPSHWHAWLHKSIDVPPINYKHRYGWQKNHQSNMTGSSKAYHPISRKLSKSESNPNIKEYETWKP